MNLKDVKKIVIPEGSVKQIQDSNGNIIWGSQTAFPYRRLEYIDMSNKYINLTVRPAKAYYYMQVKIDPSDFIKSGSTYGAYFGSTGSNNRRLMFFGKPSEVYERLKNNADTTVAKMSTLNANDLYQFNLRTYYTNNTAGTWWFAFWNQSTNTRLYGKYYNNTSYAMNLSELPALHINAYAFNSSGTSQTPTNVTVKGVLKFKFYRFMKRGNADSDPLDWDIYPCQRKSDGVVGVYNVLYDVFFPCKDASTDANVTTRTEPIADEYWDLTAPA